MMVPYLTGLTFVPPHLVRKTLTRDEPTFEKIRSLVGKLVLSHSELLPPNLATLVTVLSPRLQLDPLIRRIDTLRAPYRIPTPLIPRIVISNSSTPRADPRRTSNTLHPKATRHQTTLHRTSLHPSSSFLTTLGGSSVSVISPRLLDLTLYSPRPVQLLLTDIILQH